VSVKGSGNHVFESKTAAGTGFVTLLAVISCGDSTPTPEPPVPAPTPVKLPAPMPTPPPITLVPPALSCTTTIVGVSKGFDDGNAASLVGVEGFDDSWMGRGFNIATFDATTHVPLVQGIFDIFQGTTESTGMLSFLQSVPAGDLVVILAMDAINHWSANYLTAALKTYMSTGMQATEFSTISSFRDSYGYIGYKGSPPIAEEAKAAGTGFVTAMGTFSCTFAPTPYPTSAPPTLKPTPAPTTEPSTSSPTVTKLPTRSPPQVTEELQSVVHAI